MRIGTKISQSQNRSLRQAKDCSPSDLIQILYQISRDDDILEDREELHPDWAEIFRSRFDPRALDRYAPRSVIEQVTKFFELIPRSHGDLSAFDVAKLRTTFLLGAGASKPAPSSIPTVKELLPQLFERGRRLDRDDVTKLADYCNNREITNIEDLLTAAQLATFSSRNPAILGLLNYLLYGGEPDGPSAESRQVFYPESVRMVRRREAPAANVASVAFLQDTLQVLFGLLANTMLPAKPNKAHESIAAFVKEHPSSAIVTTNYDCCMDIALEDVKLPVTYCLEFAKHAKEETSDGAERARLIKLHGSLNWYYCETCQKVQSVEVRGTIQSYLEDRAPYSVIGICRDCGGQRRGLLVPPLAMKFDMAPPLTPLLTEAERAFGTSSAIVVVGFSFAEADVYISRMLSKAMQNKPDQKIVIIDPSSEVALRVRRKFKASIPSFDENRVVWLGEDCSEALPKLLTGGYLRSSEGSTKPPKKERQRGDSVH